MLYPCPISLSPQLFPSPTLHCLLITSFPEEHCPSLGVYHFPLTCNLQSRDHFWAAHHCIPRAWLTAGTEPLLAEWTWKFGLPPVLSNPAEGTTSQHPAPSALCSMKLHSNHWTALLGGPVSPLYAQDAAQGLPQRGART